MHPCTSAGLSVQMVEKYKDLIREMQYKEKKTILLGLVELHCDDMFRTLLRRADGIVSKLVARMAKEHNELNRE